MKAVLFVDGFKLCSKCKVPMPPEMFHKADTTKSGYTSQCKDCRNESCRKWSESHPEKRQAAWQGWVKRNPRTRRNSLLLNKFGITVDQYDELFLKQGGVCAICKLPEKLCIDHDHVTGAVRGLLCNACNIMLGRSCDNILRLQQGIDYLREFYGKS